MGTLLMLVGIDGACLIQSNGEYGIGHGIGNWVWRR